MVIIYHRTDKINGNFRETKNGEALQLLDEYFSKSKTKLKHFEKMKPNEEMSYRYM